MDCLLAVETACPAGQFTPPPYCDVDAYCVTAADTSCSDQQLQGSPLLQQLQDCNARAQRLLALLGLNREQGVGVYAAELQQLFNSAEACVVQALHVAAAAKQPLLTASSQHSSALCTLLERLHLLDAMWRANSSPGLTRTGTQPQHRQQHQQQDWEQQHQAGIGEIEAAEAEEPVRCPVMPLMKRLEMQLLGTPGLDAVLAALIAHAQQNAAAGGKLAPSALAPANSKQEVLEVSCLAAVQEQHSSARALPLLLRLYFNTGSRTETLAAGKPEPLTAKVLEQAVAVLAGKPVVPGCADMPVSLTKGLYACHGLSELATTRKLKLPTEPGKLDSKAAFKLEQSYSLQDKVLPLLQQHDELCDLLAQVALEVQQAVAVDRDLDPKAYDSAEQLVAGSINYTASAVNSLLDLDAWRLSTCVEGVDGSQGGRYKLQEQDVVPFMDVLGATKGLAGLLADSSTWLQPLLQEHALKQLNEFALHTLPALSKVYARNARLQDLLRAVYACLQGQVVEVGEDLEAVAVPAGGTDGAAEAATPTTVRSEPQQQEGRPLGEGFEGFKERWGSLKTSARRKGRRQAAAAAEEGGMTGTAADAAAEELEQAANVADPADSTAAAEQDSEQLVAAVADAAAADVEAASSAAAAAAAAAGAGSQASSPRSVHISDAGCAGPQEFAGVQGGSMSAASEGTADVEPAATEPVMSLLQQAAATAAAAVAGVGERTRKRTLKGLLKLKPGSQKKDKAAAAAAAAEAEAAAAAAAAAAEADEACDGPLAAVADEVEQLAAAMLAAAAAGQEARAEAALAEDEAAQPVSPAAVRLEHQQEGQQGLGQQQEALHAALTWTDSEPDLLLARIQSNGSGLAASAGSSAVNLSRVGFERPPDLPWERQAASAVEGDSAVTAAAAPGRQSSPGSFGAEPAGTAAPRAGRFSDAGPQMSPLSKQQLLETAGQAKGSASEQPAGATTPTKGGSKLLQGRFGLRKLLHQRAAASEASLAQQHSSSQDGAAADGRAHELLQQQSSQLLHGLESSTQEIAAADGAAIPVSWGAMPTSPLKGKQRSMKQSVMSMLRRGSARSASVGAVAVLAADGAPVAAAPAAAVDATADEQEVLAAQFAAAAVDIVNADDAGFARAGSQCGSAADTSEDFDEDQPAKTRRVVGLMNRIRVFTHGGKEPQAQQHKAQQQAAEAAGRQGLQGLKFAAKLKKAMADRRQSRFADVVGADGQAGLPLEAMPAAAMLQLLQVLLELLMLEIKAETKKHLMMQLQMAAAAAAGSARVAKPDASIARPLKQVKQMIRAVHRMRLMLDFPKQLLAAADVSALWAGAASGSSLAAIALGDNAATAAPSAADPCAACSDAGAAIDDSAGQQADTRGQGAWQQQLGCFPVSLMAACMQQLEHMPAELPLLALQVLWDARRLLKSCGLLQQGLPLLQQQEQLGMQLYMQNLVPTAYEHFKNIASHQTVTMELLSSCKAAPLQPVRQLYLDSLLREPARLVMQADYTAVGAKAVHTLEPSGLVAADQQLAQTLQEVADVEEVLQQGRALEQLQQAMQQLQKAEQELQASEQQQEEQQEEQHGELGCQERPVSDQGQGVEALRFSGVFSATKDLSSKAAPAAGSSPTPSRAGRRKRHGRGASKQHGTATGSQAATAPTAPGGWCAPGSLDGATAAGVTPLMQKLQAMGAAQEAEAAMRRRKGRRCLQAWGACELDVRDWLLAGMLEALERDAAALVARCRAGPATAVVEYQQHAAILQRTHALLSQYVALPLSWEQVWQQADALSAQQLGSSQDISEDGCSATAAAVALGLLRLLDTAVYDGEAQVLLPAQAAADAGGTCAADAAATGVLAEVQAALQPLRGFVGRQHLAALQAFVGPEGLQLLIEGLLDKLEQEQELLTQELLLLQQQLPPNLLQLPPAELCHNAGAVLQFYQQQLSGALQDHSTCQAALSSLQRTGNCLALLYLLSVQQAVQATPTFMQVAPLLGIVGRPLTDAAVASECFEGVDLPAPPAALAAAAAGTTGCLNLSKACTPGLLMPEIEALVPSDHARHTHEMRTLKELQQEDARHSVARQSGMPQEPSNTLGKPGGDLSKQRVWQASHFQRLLLGPDAAMVRGPGMLLTQTAELRAWRATEGVDVLGPCLQRLQLWALQLQERLQARQRPQHKAKATKQQRSGRGQRRSKHTAAAAEAASVQELQQQAATAATAGAAEWELTEVEQRLQALQVQVSNALTAAQGRLQETSLAEADIEGPALQQQQQQQPHEADSMGHAAADAAAESECADSPFAPVPALLSAEEVKAAVEAAEAAASLHRDPWEADYAAAKAEAELLQAAVPPAHAKLAYKFLMQSLPASQTGTALGSFQQQGGEEGASGQSSGRAGLMELLAEEYDVSARAASSFGSRPASARAGAPQHSHTAAQEHDQDSAAAAAADAVGGSSARGSPRSSGGAGADAGSVQKDGAGGDLPGSPRSPSRLSPRRAAAASCPGRCEGLEDDAASESDVRAHPWQQPHAAAAAAEAGSSSSPQATPKGLSDTIPDLLFETTCDELVRVKDERDILKSEVEVLRSQLANRDNTLAMLSGQMLNTPRASTADGDSVMHAAMSESSAASLALRSLPGGPKPAEAATAGAAAGTGSVLRSPRSASAATPVQQQQQCRLGGKPPLSPRRGAEAVAPVSMGLSGEPSGPGLDSSKCSVRAQQTTPCADVSMNEAGALSGTEHSSNTLSSNSSEDGSCSDHSPEACGEDWDELEGLEPEESCIIDTAACGASRKLRMPRAITARRSSNSSGKNPSPWPAAQLAVTLSALKFVLLMDVAVGADSAAHSQGAQAASNNSSSNTQAPSSPLKRLRKAVEGPFAAPAGAAPVPADSCPATPAGATQQHAAATGAARHLTTAQLGDGPLLASAVLLALSGQARRFEVLDATSRITHWVEYDAVKSSSRAAEGAAAGATGDAAANGASPGAPSGVAAIVGAPGGIGPAAQQGIAAPKPSSKKRQEEEALALAQERAAAAAQQQLLERLAAAHRQAARICKDGSSLAARFAPAAPARSQNVRLQVFRVDSSPAALPQSAGGTASALRSSGGGSCPGRITFGGAAAVPGSPAHNNTSVGTSGVGGGATADGPKVPAVPVKPVTLQFSPRRQPWSGIRPTQRPIQPHSSLPMPRPQPLLLHAAPSGASGARGATADLATCMPPAAAAALPAEAAAAAAAAAAAGASIVGPSGRLLAGANVAPRAGLVAAARAAAAREVLLANVPRRAAYSFSVVSDQNRSGRPEDGYSMAPSSDLESLGPESPRRSPQRMNHMMGGVVSSPVRRSIGRQRGPGCLEGTHAAGLEQWGTAASPAGDPGSARKSAARSPGRRPASGQGGSLLARAFG